MKSFIHLTTTPLFSPSEQPISDMMPSYENAFLKMFLTLITLLVVVFAIIWLLKKFSTTKFFQNQGKSIKILESKPLSPKTMLYIIEIEGKKTLIAESQLEIKNLLTFNLSETETIRYNKVKEQTKFD